MVDRSTISGPAAWQDKFSWKVTNYSLGFTGPLLVASGNVNRFALYFVLTTGQEVTFTPNSNVSSYEGLITNANHPQVELRFNLDGGLVQLPWYAWWSGSGFIISVLEGIWNVGTD